MDENKLLDRIKDSAENIDVPDALKPEQIKGKLKKRRRKIPVFGMATAAVLVIVLAVTLQQKPLDVEPETTQTRDIFAHVADEEDLYTALAGLANSEADWINETEAAIEMEDAVTSDMATASEPGYSETNIQEVGVDEGDIVKTDGQYLYILKASGEVRIVKADGAQLKETSKIEIPDVNITIEEMYLDGDKLFLIGSGFESGIEEIEADAYYINQQVYTRLYTYNIEDRKSPSLLGSVQQDGYYRTSRKNGDYVYLFTEYVPRVEDTKEKSTLFPEVGDERIMTDSIYMPEYLNQTTYLVISSVNVNAPSKILDKKAIVSAAALFYVSTENIYIGVNNYGSDTEMTQIIRFSYQEGKIQIEAIGAVDGYLNDSFSLNESKGYLRLVTTGWSSTESQNHLYVLDEQMKIVGQIKGLAPGETIQSARFFGDIGYFVTFRNIDPLFSVDLSDPKNPKLLGELKVTGFSSYLHFYGEDKLLGIGSEVDPETGYYEGIKLSMFDIADPSNVKEVDKYVMKEAYDAPALYNYKAIMIDPDKNIFGFVCEGKYLIFSYDQQKGFVSEFVGALTDDWGYYESARGIYIGDTFYLVEYQGVKAYDMKNEYTQIGEVELN